MRPLVGVTLSFDETNFLINKSYFRAVLAASAFPVGICCEEGDVESYTGSILKKIDCLILSGGGDIHPKFYNEELSPETRRILEKRDEFELTLCKKALEMDMPVLGICRGIQLLNVAAGGTLHQHVDNHFFPDLRDKMVHDVTVKENTLLHRIFKNRRISVNSIHHQALHKIPEGMTATAESTDGIIEAIEMPGKKFVLAVQWHPEALIENYKTHLEIFKKLTGACR